MTKTLLVYSQEFRLGSLFAEYRDIIVIFVFHITARNVKTAVTRNYAYRVLLRRCIHVFYIRAENFKHYLYQVLGVKIKSTVHAFGIERT